MTTAKTGSIPTVSKPEAIRRAIAALGFRAEVPDLLAYIEEHFILVDSALPTDDRQPDTQATMTETPAPEKTSPDEPSARASKRGKAR